MTDIKPCPFCGGECLTDVGKYSSWVFCDVCSYECRDFEHEPDAIAAHNRVAGAVECGADLLLLVEAVEWVENEVGWNECPWCHRDKHMGHAPDCPRQAVLAKVRG